MSESSQNKNPTSFPGHSLPESTNEPKWVSEIVEEAEIEFISPQKDDVLLTVKGQEHLKDSLAKQHRSLASITFTRGTEPQLELTFAEEKEPSTVIPLDLSHCTLSHKDITKAEESAIIQRRRVAFGLTDQKGQDKPPQNLVGLALSGGGIRSALFNDGFLQALSHRGLLRYVDYLSSISGGGYIGGHLVSTAIEHQKQTAELSSSSKNTDTVETSSFHDVNHLSNLGRDPKTHKIEPEHLNGAGQYLSRPLTAFINYLCFHIFTMMFYVGLAGVCASCIALYWRTLDDAAFKDCCQALGLFWGEELQLAFLPFLMLFFWLWVPWCIYLISRWGYVFLGLTFIGSCWLTGPPNANCGFVFLYLVGLFFLLYAFGLKRHNSAPGHSTAFRVFTFLNFFTFLIGIAVFLGNSWTQTGLESHSDPNGGYFLNNLSTFLAASAALTQIVVFLGRDRLLKSEERTASAIQQRLQALISWGVVAGMAFAMVHFMSREDISGYTRNRDLHIVRAEIRDWPLFYKMAKNFSIPDENIFEKELIVDKEFASTIGRISDWNRRQYSEFQVPFESGNTSAEPESPFLPPEDSTTYISEEWLPLRALYLCWYASPISPKILNEYSLGKKLDRYLAKREELRKTQSTLVRKVNKELKKLETTETFYKRLIGNEPGKASIPITFPNSRLDHYKIVSDFAKGRGWSKPRKQKLARSLESFEGGIFDNKKWAGSVFEKRVLAMNRELVELLFPGLLFPRHIASTPVVQPHDQAARKRWLTFWCICTSVGFLFTIDINSFSPMYRFYRSMLAENFIKGKADIKLSDCDPTSCGMPYPLFTATLMYRDRSHQGRSVLQQLPFLFTPKYVGISSWKENLAKASDQSSEFIPSWSYEVGGKVCELADAVAISGSAVTPFMSKSRPLRFLMDFCGLRLGQWISRPGRSTAKLWGYYTLFREYQSSHSKDHEWEHAFVADGGFVDYLGVQELLKRRCQLIVVTDAGSNLNGDEHGPLANMLCQSAADQGVRFLDLDLEIPIDVNRLTRDANRQVVPQPYLCMRIRYPDDTPDGHLIYAQMSVTDSDPIEIRQIRKRFPQFPDEPTTNQSYTDDQARAFQQLGYHIGNRICSELAPWEQDEIKNAHFAQNSLRKFTGYFGEPSCKNETNTEPTFQPLFDSIVRRLLVGFRSACFEELMYKEGDIYAEAIWDRKEWCFPQFAKRARETFGCSIHEKSGSNPSGCSADAWLTVYEQNADVRAAYRHAVFHDINHEIMKSGRVSTKGVAKAHELLEHLVNFTPVPRRDTKGEQLVNNVPNNILMAHISVLAVACHQLHRGTPHSVFQVGGRQKLLDVIESIVANGNRDNWRYESAAEILELRRCVFQGAELETTVSVAQLLIMLPDNAILDDLFEFRRKASRAIHADDSKALAKIMTPSYVAIETVARINNILSDAAFDHGTITSAIGWINNILSQDWVAIDSQDNLDVFDAISNWSRAVGDRSEHSLKDRFCAALVGQVSQYRDRICLSVEVCNSYYAMLSVLGDMNNSNIQEALKELATRQLKRS